MGTANRLIAPDLPGFAFTQALKLTRYTMYVFGYGAPTGFRLALMAPERMSAIIFQNGNAYEEGLGDAWKPIQRYWREPTLESLSEDHVKVQVVVGPVG